MRNWPAILALIAAASFAGLPARGDEQRPAASIRVDMQIVSVSVAQARELVPALQDRKTAPTAWTHLQEMIRDGQVKLIDWPVVTLQSGTRVVAENVVEYRYATEPMPRAPPQPVIVETPWPLFPIWSAFTPTAFETSNVGCSLEIEAWVEPGGQVIDLNLVSQHLRLARFREWRGQESPIGLAGIQQQPEFQSAKVTTQMHIHRDEPALAGVFVFAEPHPHVELHILHARVTLLPPSAPTFPP